MKPETYLLPRADFGWFSLGICGTAFLMKLGIKTPGFHSLLVFSFLTLFLLYSVLPRLTSHQSDKRIYLCFFASFLFLFLADFQGQTQKRITNPFFRSHLENQIKHSPLSKFESRIVMGFVTGSTKEIPGDFKDLAKESGILHLFAASGLHLGIFVGSIQFFGNLCFPKRKWISLFLSLSLGFIYLAALDFPVSFLRAYLFVFLTLIASLFYRKIGPADLLIISSACIAFFLFYDFLSIGFLLSFGAVFGIFFIKPNLDKLIFPDSKSFLKENLHLTIACSLCSFPILVYYFRSFSFGGIGINFLLVPMAGILLPTLYMTLFLQSLVPSFLLEPLASWVWVPASFELSIFLKLFHFFSESVRGYKTWMNVPKGLFALSVFLILCIPFYSKLQFLNRPILRFGFYILPSLFFGFSYFYPTQPFLPKFITKLGKGNLSIRFEDHLYLFGTCYSKKMTEPSPGFPPPKSISFESESCLSGVLSQIKKHQITDVFWHGTSHSENWIRQFPLPIKLKNQKILGAEMNPVFSIIRFDGNPKGVEQFLKQTREADRSKTTPDWKGVLLLDFPPWKKKEANEWIQYQKLLGISTAWKMILVEETFEIPLRDYLQHPDLL
ncbi:competence protein [Leptospira sp. mixed culture ATI2-C-A1]|nr:competence protein [Leptospira sp. mixed culture ATI2-C-A1]